MKDLAVKEQFVELRARGLSFTGIAKVLQCFAPLKIVAR